MPVPAEPLRPVSVPLSIPSFKPPAPERPLPPATPIPEMCIRDSGGLDSFDCTKPLCHKLLTTFIPAEETK